MGQLNDPTLGLSLPNPCNVAFLHLRRTAELSLPTSLLHIIQCYAAKTIIWALDLWKSHPHLQALDVALVVTVCIVVTTLALIWAAFHHADHEMRRKDYTTVSGACVIGLAIRLAKSVEGCEESTSAQLNASAMILTTVAMYLAALEAKLVEPGMRSFREMFLTVNFFASVTIVVCMTYAQFTDFGRTADIWMFQMLPEFGFALLLDWAHIKTAVGVGKAGQGTGHIRPRRRGGGGEADLPNPNAEVDVEWEYVL